MATTPSGSAHWLTPGELLVSGLATHFIDGPRPIHYGAGLNGLKGSTIDGRVTGDFLAEGAAPMTLGDQRSAEVNIEVRYRPAGGNALVDLIVRYPGSKEAIQAGKNGALLVVGPKGPAFAALPRKDRRLRMIVPLSLICQLRGAQAATLTLFDDEAGTDGAWSPVPVHIDALAGAKPLLDEACPHGRSTQ